MRKICTRCIYDETTPAISFDEMGVCNYCKMIDQLQDEYKTGTEEGEETFCKIAEEIRSVGKKKKYDCVVGVSGGTDSSYMLFKLVKTYRLRPLAVHYDNTWNSAIATQNIRKILSKLNVDLCTHVLANDQSDDLFRAFFLAGVPELDGPTDIGCPEFLYRVCAKYGIKYVIEGHSFRAEGVSPLGSMYIDGKYIQSVHRKYGTVNLTTFPNMTLFNFLKWTLVYRIKKIRPLWYIAYSKEEARKVLQKEFNWCYYGGHHLENRLTAFHHSYYNPVKFGIDQRNNSLSASVRSGMITRDQALEEYSKSPFIEPGLIEYFKKRLGFSNEDFEKIMNGQKRCYRDFKTYKRTFERMRPLFYIMYKMNLVPKSFYIKYTSKAEI